MVKCPICENKVEEDEIKFDVCDNGHSAKDVIKLANKQKKGIKKILNEIKKARKLHMDIPLDFIIENLEKTIK